jgi:hypothetical protein
LGKKKICKLINANICKQCLHAVQQTKHDRETCGSAGEKSLKLGSTFGGEKIR